MRYITITRVEAIFPVGVSGRHIHILGEGDAGGQYETKISPGTGPNALTNEELRGIASLILCLAKTGVDKIPNSLRAELARLGGGQLPLDWGKLGRKWGLDR